MATRIHLVEFKISSFINIFMRTGEIICTLHWDGGWGVGGCIYVSTITSLPVPLFPVSQVYF